jgi:hypothetical protein
MLCYTLLSNRAGKNQNLCESIDNKIISLINVDLCRDMDKYSIKITIYKK